MARIRTIKPEFPQSESMGRVSRDARLLFVQLWTICDDHGKARGNSRMLASLLFPYDDDAGSLIDGWLDELEREGCIQRYQYEGQAYVKIEKWLDHQRVDKPSVSKFPDPPEASRKFAKPRENSSRTKEGTKDQGREGTEGAPAAPEVDECQEAMERWNVLAGEIDLPRAAQMTEPRRRALKARLAECGGLDGWDAALKKVRESRFLRGDSRDGWRADFDFVLQAKSFTKLREGAYDNRDTPAQRRNFAEPVQSSEPDWGRRLADFKAQGFWLPAKWGAKPTEPGCIVPRSILKQYGYGEAA